MVLLLAMVLVRASLEIKLHRFVGLLILDESTWKLSSSCVFLSALLAFFVNSQIMTTLFPAVQLTPWKLTATAQEIQMPFYLGCIGLLILLLPVLLCCAPSRSRVEPDYH
jgi:hypothetical protein